MLRTADITITEEGRRDAGKVFRLTEMPAFYAEKWAARALIALAKAGVELPEGAADAGFAGLAAVGIRKLGTLAWADAEPLLDEMLGCIQVVPDPQRKLLVRAMLPQAGDIEEISTLVQLRLEVLKLHLDFSKGVGQSNSAPTP